MSLAIAISLVLVALWSVYVRLTHVAWRARSQGLQLPPGPSPLPIIGNLFDMPKLKPWLGFRAMRAKYGDVVYMKVLREHIIVIGNAILVREFLDKRSGNTADRPLNPVIELSGQSYNFVFMPYGQSWRNHRRLFWQHFRPGAIKQYRSLQLMEARGFLAKLLESPSQLKSHIRSTFSSLMLKVVYDIDIDNGRDDLIKIFDEGMEAVSLASPGNFAVEMFPLLRHIPSWVPGAGFQRLFARCKVANDRLKDELWKDAKNALERGEPRSCVATDIYRAGSRPSAEASITVTSAYEELLADVCLIAFEGGADTTFSATQALFVALALYPDVQRKAQSELDAVIGPSRLPDHADSDALVYVNALIKELLRWHAGVPLGLAHRTIGDDEFCGYFIPAGTTVIPNTWDILHDPEVYENPHEFRPERFIRDGTLDPTVQDPALFAFGFGRRICPGRHFALASLLITVASVLHVFDIGPPLDEQGRTIPIRYEQSHGLLSYPEDCRCTIKPRSPRTLALIKAAKNFGGTL